MSGGTLVAGIGNLLLGDDGFGVEVARRLATRPLGPDVRVADFGIRGMDLAFAILDGYDDVILIDATRRGGPPGSLYVLEPVGVDDAFHPHSLVPTQVLALVRRLGGSPRRVRIVGCEPALIPAGDELHMGLSAPVRAAVEPAVRLVAELVAEPVPHA